MSFFPSQQSRRVFFVRHFPCSIPFTLIWVFRVLFFPLIISFSLPLFLSLSRLYGTSFRGDGMLFCFFALPYLFSVARIDWCWDRPPHEPEMLESERKGGAHQWAESKLDTDISCACLHVFGALVADCEGEIQDSKPLCKWLFGAMFLFVSFAQPNLLPELLLMLLLLLLLFVFSEQLLIGVSLCWTFNVSVWLHNNKFLWTIALYNTIPMHDSLSPLLFFPFNRKFSVAFLPVSHCFSYWYPSYNGMPFLSWYSSRVFFKLISVFFLQNNFSRQ